MPPRVESFAIDRALPDVLRRLDINQYQELRQIGDVVQVMLPGQPERLYINIKTGKLLPGGDRERAVKLARHYAGLTEASIREVVLVTAFSPEYTHTNRYLPVWKVSFDDPRRLFVYVDTRTDRLASITDRRKVILQSLFQILHTGAWLESVEVLRLTVIGFLMLAALGIILSGLYMLLRLRGQRRGWRKLHRGLAYAASLPLMMFTISGFFHLFVQSPLIYGAHADVPVSVDVGALRHMPEGKADDLRFVAPAWWRVEQGKDVTYLNAMEGRRIEGDAAFVRERVPEAQGEIRLVTSFTDEYGFAYKRLPVWRVDTGRELIFFEARTGAVAARIDPLKAAESWSFSRMHKWQFLDSLSERISGPGPFKAAFRDAVMVLFILAGLGMSVLGLLIRFKR